MVNYIIPGRNGVHKTHFNPVCDKKGVSTICMDYYSI